MRPIATRILVARTDPCVRYDDGPSFDAALKAAADDSRYIAYDDNTAYRISPTGESLGGWHHFTKNALTMLANSVVNGLMRVLTIYSGESAREGLNTPVYWTRKAISFWNDMLLTAPPRKKARICVMAKRRLIVESMCGRHGVRPVPYESLRELVDDANLAARGWSHHQGWLQGVTFRWRLVKAGVPGPLKPAITLSTSAFKPPSIVLKRGLYIEGADFLSVGPSETITTLDGSWRPSQGLPEVLKTLALAEKEPALQTGSFRKAGKVLAAHRRTDGVIVWEDLVRKATVRMLCNDRGLMHRTLADLGQRADQPSVVSIVELLQAMAKHIGESYDIHHIGRAEALVRELLRLVAAL